MKTNKENSVVGLSTCRWVKHKCFTLIELLVVIIMFYRFLSKNIYTRQKENKEFFKMLTGVEIRLIEVIYVLLMVLVAWLVFVALAIFAITLSTTLLSNWKFKGVVSVIIYFALDWCVSKVATLVTPTGFLEGEYLVVNTEAWAFIGVYVATLVLSYVGTALLLDKKVSV